MIFHDGKCTEHHIEHTPGHDSNPAIWSIPADETWTVPANHPVTGWRFAVVHYINDVVILADGFDAENPTPWEGTIATPRATCDPRRWGPRTITNSIDRALTHTSAPAALCECGYRIVQTLGELARYLQWARGQLAPYPTHYLPQPLAELAAELGDMVHQSMTIVSVQGCGDAGGAHFETYSDPDGTVRVEWLATRGHFIASHDDPVITALDAWGAHTVAVPDVTEVHEPDECDIYTQSFNTWKLTETQPPSPSDIQLTHGTTQTTGDGYTATGRWGHNGAAGIAINNDNKILLVWSGSRWQLPGGALNAGETPGECVVREALEEIQADITHIEVTGAFAHTDASGWTYTTITATGHVHATPGAEVSDTGWFSTPPVGCHPDLEAVWGKLATRS